MASTCYTCRAVPAGHPDNPYSAYCAGCQPREDAPPGRSQSGCSRCRQVFGTLASFTGHLVHDAGSAVVLACAPPRVLGLVPDQHGTWQTPEGLAKREADAVRGRRTLAALRQDAASRQQGRA
jgi:hypothetical protein